MSMVSITIHLGQTVDQIRIDRINLATRRGNIFLGETRIEGYACLQVADRGRVSTEFKQTALTDLGDGRVEEATVRISVGNDQLRQLLDG